MKGRPTCPVCGRGYRGDLAAHMNKVVDSKYDDAAEAADAIIRGELVGMTRCDWNLNLHRIASRPGKLREQGWVEAGSTAARCVALLKDTHPHLARHDGSGGLPSVASAYHMNPANDFKVWWTRPWVKELATVSSWPMLQRVQIIRELDGDAKRLEVIEAVARVGGKLAVANLEGNLFPARCRAKVLFAVDVPDRGGAQASDWCCKAAGHAGDHLGARRGLPFSCDHSGL